MMHFINANNKTIVLQQNYSLEKSPVLIKAGEEGEKHHKLSTFQKAVQKSKQNIILKRQNF